MLLSSSLSLIVEQSKVRNIALDHRHELNRTPFVEVLQPLFWP